MKKRDHIPVCKNGPGHVVRSGGCGLGRADGNTFLWVLGLCEAFRFFHVTETCLPETYIHLLRKEADVMKEKEKVRWAWGFLFRLSAPVLRPRTSGRIPLSSSAAPSVKWGQKHGPVCHHAVPSGSNENVKAKEPEEHDDERA